MMKVLSLQQPWASLIAAGIKDVENRTWKPKEIPSKILIHASKKCSMHTVGNEPIEWIQEILNEQMMGNIPDFPDMPSNAIIGYFSIDRIDKRIDNSIWASGEDDSEDLYYWHVKDCYLFDEPIKDVKGKLWLWDYDLDENNLPPAHKVELQNYDVKDDDFIMPINEKKWNTLDENQNYMFDLSITSATILCQEGSYDLKPCKNIVFTCNGKSRKFKLTDETEIRVILDENNEPTKFFSLLNADGAECFLAHFAWGEEIK